MRTTVMSRLIGTYVGSIYLPISTFLRDLRTFSRWIRGVRRGQQTNLPIADWREVIAPIRLTATRKNNGNVSLSELAVLASLAATTGRGDEIIEIGTFDGRTTLNLAINAPPAVSVVTLDLPPTTAPRFELAESERVYVEKPSPGQRFIQATRWSPEVSRITQLFGDSATFDWSGHFGRAGLVFVDGSHSYDYAMSDSDTAFRLVAPGGIIVWHDYGVWEGVTRALDEIEENCKIGLRHIRGTSLVYCVTGTRPTIKRETAETAAQS
jgi:predicted O-methyltransferase YrrM